MTDIAIMPLPRKALIIMLNRQAAEIQALQAENAGVKLGREQAAAKLDEWQDTPTLLLACGEMTAQEIRTVKAVLRQRAKIIRDLP
jgi:hypothetical protein